MPIPDPSSEGTIDSTAEIGARREEYSRRYIASEFHVRRVHLLAEAMRLAMVGLQKERDEFASVAEAEVDGLLELAWLVQAEAAKLSAVHFGKDENGASAG